MLLSRDENPCQSVLVNIFKSLAQITIFIIDESHTPPTVLDTVMPRSWWMIGTEKSSPTSKHQSFKFWPSLHARKFKTNVMVQNSVEPQVAKIDKIVHFRSYTWVFECNFYVPCNFSDKSKAKICSFWKWITVILLIKAAASISIRHFWCGLY